MSRKPIDMSGERYGRLTVISSTGQNNGNGNEWLCKCDCGENKIVGRKLLVLGKTKSCGCLQSENGKKFCQKGRERISAKRDGTRHDYLNKQYGYGDFYV